MKAIYVFLIGVVIGVWLRRQSEPGYVMHLEPLPDVAGTWNSFTWTWTPDLRDPLHLWSDAWHGPN